MPLSSAVLLGIYSTTVSYIIKEICKTLLFHQKHLIKNKQLTVINRIGINFSFCSQHTKLHKTTKQQITRSMHRISLHSYYIQNKYVKNIASKRGAHLISSYARKKIMLYIIHICISFIIKSNHSEVNNFSPHSVYRVLLYYAYRIIFEW